MLSTVKDSEVKQKRSYPEQTQAIQGNMNDDDVGDDEMMMVI